MVEIRICTLHIFVLETVCLSLHLMQNIVILIQSNLRPIFGRGRSTTSIFRDRFGPLSRDDHYLIFNGIHRLLPAADNPSLAILFRSDTQMTQILERIVI